jgi:hypothetical protein
MPYKALYNEEARRSVSELASETDLRAIVLRNRLSACQQMSAISGVARGGVAIALCARPMTAAVAASASGLVGAVMRTGMTIAARPLAAMLGGGVTFTCRSTMRGINRCRSCCSMGSLNRARHRRLLPWLLF